MELNRREFAVLSGVVERYIRVGTPVASREVAKSAKLQLSPASIRSVMAKLEEEGYLSRSHASAGCVPTDRSFRLYVDSLDWQRRLPAGTRSQLLEKISASKRELVEDMEWVARVTAEVTKEVGMAVRPIDDEPVLEAVSLVHLSGTRVLGVIVTTDGAVEKRMLNRDRVPTSAELQEESNYLCQTFRGMSLERIRQETALDEDGENDHLNSLHRRAARFAHQLFREDLGELEVQLAGADQLFGSEDFAETHRMRSLLSTLEDRRRIASAWRRALDDRRTQVIIGRESDVTASGNLGMVATLFYRHGRRVGALGVVGPRRMDYCRIVPMVEFIGDTLTKMLEEPGATHA